MNLADCIDGILRVSQLRSLQTGVIDSVIEFCEFLAEWLNTLSSYVRIDYYQCWGNHDEIRILTGKKGDFPHENVNKIIMKFLELSLSNNTNVVIHNEDLPYIYFDICGSKVFGYHGEDKNLPKTLKWFEDIYGVNIDYILDTNDFNKDDNSVIIGEWLGTSTDYFEFFEDSTFEYTCYSNTCPSDFLVQTPIGGNHKTCYTKGTYELKNEKSIYLYPTQSTCEISSDIVIWAFASDYTYFCANNGGICFGGWQKSSDTPYHLNIDGTRIK